MLTRTALHRFTRPGHPTVSVTVLPHAGGSASYGRHETKSFLVSRSGRCSKS